METTARIFLVFLVTTILFFMLTLTIFTKYTFEWLINFVLSIGIGFIVFALFERNTPSAFTYKSRVEALYKSIYIFVVLHIVVAGQSSDILLDRPATNVLEAIPFALFSLPNISSTFRLLIAAHFALTIGYLATHFFFKDSFTSLLLGYFSLVFGGFIGFFLSIYILDNFWFINLTTLTLMVNWFIYNQMRKRAGKTAVFIGY
jgi:hypothetical protein